METHGDDEVSTDRPKCRGQRSLSREVSAATGRTALSTKEERRDRSTSLDECIGGICQQNPIAGGADCIFVLKPQEAEVVEALREVRSKKQKSFVSAPEVIPPPISDRSFGRSKCGVCAIY